MTPDQWLELATIGLKLFFIGGCILVVAHVGYLNWRRFRESNARRETAASNKVGVPEVKRRPRTYAVKLDGQCYVMSVGLPPPDVLIAGYDTQAYLWERDDFLEVFSKNGTRLSRYQISELSRHQPSAFFSAKCKFAPVGS